MEKPFVVCHIFVSMDGKIDGAFMSDPAAFSLLSADKVEGDGLWIRYGKL